jgi:hypothetical protein
MTPTEFDQFIKDNMAAHPAERKIIRKLWKAFKDAGDPIVAVWDGEEETKVSTLEEVNRCAFNLDQFHLYTKSDGWVFIVMGNEWDALSDYTLDLEEAIKPVEDYIRTKW